MSLVKISGNASGTGTLTIAAPNTNTDYTLTLPTNTGTILTTSGTITASQLPAGSVLQVVSTFKNDTFSTASSTFVDVTGLSVSITPTSASSKILIFVSLGNVVDSADVAYAILLRGSTQIANSSGSDGVLGGGYSGGSSSGESYYGIRTISLTYLDSPSTTSSTTYKIQIRSNTGTAYAAVATEIERLIPIQLAKMATENRRSAYIVEADPLFFKAQRGEATMEEWQAKVAEIKTRFPK